MHNGPDNCSNSADSRIIQDTQYKLPGPQRMLLRLLEDKFKTLIYCGGVDYTATRSFKGDSEFFFSTNNGT